MGIRFERDEPGVAVVVTTADGTEHYATLAGIFIYSFVSLVADCGGADGGSRWMTENNIIAELDWRLWKRLTERHGRPLEIGLR